MRFRVTPEERDLILRFSSGDGYREYSDYVRDLALKIVSAKQAGSPVFKITETLTGSTSSELHSKKKVRGS